MPQYIRKLFGIVLLGATLLVGGCSTQEWLTHVMPFSGSVQGENYAEARYEKAVQYMKHSRFELARQQFAIAAAAANTEELRMLALAGYNRTERALAVQR